MKKTITAAILAATVLALCIACQNPGGSITNGGEEGAYIIYTSAVNGVIDLSSKNKRAKENETIEVNAAPLSSDYRLVKGSIQVITQSDTVKVTIIEETNTQGNYSFAMPAANVVVSALFRKISADVGGPPLTKNQIFSGGRFNNAVLTGYNRHVPWYCDDEGRLAGTQAIRVGPDEFSENGAGFSIKMNAEYAINLNEVNALSFWARSPDAIRVQSVEFGSDTTNANTYSITYTGEDDSGIAIDREWTRYLIPVPNNRNVAVDGVFTLRINSREGSRTLYIDDIEYITAAVSLANIVLPEPDPISIAETTPLARIIYGMKAVYTVDTDTVSLYNRNIDFSKYYAAATYNVSGGGVSLNNTASEVSAQTPGGTYTLSVTLDSVNESVTGNVSPVRFITIEDCMPAEVKTIEGNSGETGPGGYHATSWDASFEKANGKPCLQILNRRWNGNRDWDREGIAGRTLPAALDLTQYSKIVITARSAGGPGLGLHVRLWQGGLEDDQMYSTVMRTVSNIWQKVEIPLADSFRHSERGNDGAVLISFDDITRWEIATDYNNFNENYLYIDSIRVSE